MIIHLSPGNPAQPIEEHWFGEYDGQPMPTLDSGPALVNVLSLNTQRIVSMEGVCSRRLYFPWSFASEYGASGTNYLQFGESGISLLTGSACVASQREPSFQARPLNPRPVSAAEAAKLRPKWFTGDHPVEGYWGESYPVTCLRCESRMRFVLQIESGGPDETFVVFDGETLYYGWCSKCDILAVEAHTY